VFHNTTVCTVGQVSGYQFDLDSNNRFTGQLYEGQGRGIINEPGGVVLLRPGADNLRIGKALENLASAVKPHNGLAGEWQQVQIVARGNTLTHILNGQVVTVSIDDDPAARASQGILSLQLEGSCATLPAGPYRLPSGLQAHRAGLLMR